MLDTAELEQLRIAQAKEIITKYGNIYFVGMMGVGKTTIAKTLAKKIHLPYVDTDVMIEKKTGVKISDIFDIEGEDGFRDRETKVLQEIANKKKLIVATGGGIVTKTENQKIMRDTGLVVFIQLEANRIFKRISKDISRPLLTTANPKQKLIEISNSRQDLYEKSANFILDINSISSANKIVEYLITKIINYENSN